MNTISEHYSWQRGVDGDMIAFTLHNAPRNGYLFIETDAINTGGQDVCAGDRVPISSEELLEIQEEYYARYPVGTLGNQSAWRDSASEVPCIFRLHWTSPEKEEDCNCLY